MKPDVENRANPRCCDDAQACVVIPVYNHARTVGDVVRGALEHATTVLVCDDGSLDGSGQEAARAGATVFRLPSNQGKGVALHRLFTEAASRGFKHAICMDADGQHLASDLPPVVEALAVDPGALIVGSRDLVAAGAPGSSEFGRRFSNFWIWMETGKIVEDSQCGLRAYPLPEVLQLRASATRYEYEVEILLRAAWAGIPIRSVSIDVVYPKDRVTHFRPFIDNTRITLLNTLICFRLFVPWPLVAQIRNVPRQPGLSFYAIRRWMWLGAPGPLARMLTALLGGVATFGMGATWTAGLLFLSAALGLGVLPMLAARLVISVAESRGIGSTAALLGALGLAGLGGLAESVLSRREYAPRKWTGKSRGGVFGHWFFYTVLRVFGLAPAYLAVIPVALYFVFAAGRAREASTQYLERVLGPASFIERLRRSYRHFLTFAQTLVDRAAVGIRGRSGFHFTEKGFEHMSEAAVLGSGGILLTAHFGNWELASMILDGVVSAPVSIAVFEGEEERLKDMQSRVKGRHPKIISVDGEPLSTLEMFRALRAGELVAMQGDRCLRDEAVRIPFLGQDASWPSGPFRLAAASGAAVVATFSVKVGPRAYSLFADPPQRFSFDSTRPRDAQLRSWMESYVRRLEGLVREYPYQWFNFYDFWSTSPLAATTAPSSRPERK